MPEKTSDIWWLFSRQTVSITTKENVLNAALLMKNRNFRHLPVLSENGKILGILSIQDIIDSLNLTLKSSTSAEEVKRSLEISVERIMTGRPIVVEPGDGLKEVINKFSYHNVGALPVVNLLGVVEGIITLRDLVSLMGMSSSPLNVPVSEMMNTNVTTVGPDSSLARAVALMSERRVRRLPVVAGGETVGDDDEDGGERGALGASANVPGDDGVDRGEAKKSPPKRRRQVLMGLLTNKDVVRHIARLVKGGQESSGFERRISEFMTADVITVSGDDDARVAANLMTTFGVGGLVIDDLPSGKIALVTERDLIRSLQARRGMDFLMAAMQYEREAEDAMSRIRLYTSR